MTLPGEDQAIDPMRPIRRQSRSDLIPRMKTVDMGALNLQVCEQFSHALGDRTNLDVSNERIRVAVPKQIRRDHLKTSRQQGNQMIKHARRSSSGSKQKQWCTRPFGAHM